MISLLLAGLLLQAPAPPPPAPDAPPALPRELALQVENNVLRLALLRKTIEAEQLAISMQREAIDAAVRAALPGYEGIDWSTGQPKKKVQVPPAGTGQP